MLIVGSAQTRTDSMPQDFIVPNSRSTSLLLQMFLGNGLTVTESDSTDLSNRYVATYVDDDDQLVAFCSCDCAFVAYAGAALSMIPPDVANDAIAGGNMSGPLVGNFHEIMNICSKLLMSDSSAHLRLDKTLTPDQASDTTLTLGESPEKVSAFSVDIPGYGIGSITFRVS